MIRPEQWSPVAGLVLEPNAHAAVTETERNVVVSAGPGAGKTELLAQRADFLFRTRTCRYPRRILAISFKVDAARNLYERVRLRSGPEHSARFDSLTFHAFAKRLIDNYRPALTGQNALNPDYRVDPDTRIPRTQITYREFVPFALEILQNNPHARGALRQTYSHVFLDEFQDATGEQYQLLAAAFGNTDARLTAVGDPKQSIMAWADALEGVMATYAEDFTALPLPLYQNRRSAPTLRRMQNRMVLDMDPASASPDEDLIGEAGTIDVIGFETAEDEAVGVADRVAHWLADGTPPSEIAVLVRNQPHLVLPPMAREFAARGIPCRNEHDKQALTAEPAASLVLNFLRVVADEGHPKAYAQVIQLATRGNATQEHADVLDAHLRKLLAVSRATVRAPGFDHTDFTAWKGFVQSFLRLITRPVLTALSPSYQQGSRLNEVIKEALSAFKEELAADGDSAAALKRLSDEDAVRVLTIHKCKGLEFDKVIVLGVETDFFFGEEKHVLSEFFVAISRAKTTLTLTYALYRERPGGANWRWGENRTPFTKLLDYAGEPQQRSAEHAYGVT